MSRSISNITRDPSRIAARAVLAASAGLLALLLATIGFGGALAQTPTNPSEPTPIGTAPQIQLLNPEKTTSLEVSDKNDGANETYHLNAWTANSPSGAVVEFEVRGTSATNAENVAVYTANRVGTTDTWEYFWDIPSGWSDGAYEVVASLFSGEGTSSAALAEDREAITINKGGPGGLDTDPAAETVEIIYPTNAGPLGVKRVVPPRSTTSTTPSPNPQATPGSEEAANFVLRGTASAGTTYVKGYYSISPGGGEPEFLGCQTSGGSAPRYQAIGPSGGDTPRSFSYRCVISAEHADKAITAVAIVTNDTPRNLTGPQASADPANDDSSDAHRSFSYNQVPTTVELEPSHTDGATVESCVSLRATVLDQQAEPIAGQNVDVHATGPTDQLRFNIDDDRSSSPVDKNQAPDSGNHSTEPAYHCAFGEVDGLQGEHNRAGAPDNKHIESEVATTGLERASGGTSNSGVFHFQLRSDAQGVTQVTAWADTVDDDLWGGQDQNEPCGNASIGWGDFGAPPPSGGSPDFSSTSCLTIARQTSPTPTGSPTGSPSPTATQSPSPTPTQSPSPTTTEVPECRDGIDNDDDGDVDHPADSGCSSPDDDDERGDERCPGQESDPRNHIVGTQDNDTLHGTEGDDVICGLGGDDLIFGNGGNDLVLGGDGDDSLLGGDGNDTLEGEDGKDDLRGGNGDDILRGGLQNDDMRGNVGNDQMFGGNGFDVIRGGAGHDEARGGSGNDTLQGFTGRDTLVGNSGNDTIKGGGGRDDLRGGRDDDVISGGKGPDRIRGGPGRDACAGGPGNNDVRGCEA